LRASFYAIKKIGAHLDLKVSADIQQAELKTNN